MGHLGKTKSNGLIDFMSVTEEERRRLRESTGRVVEGDIPVDETFGGRVLEIYSLDRTNYTHGFHKFPAKFIPEIPRWAILKFSKERGTVLDPFCGSGTTNVEARLHRRNSYALDVDPIAQILTKVKTTPLDEKELRAAKDWLFRAIHSMNEAEIPDFPNRDYWFRPEVLRDLGVITQQIRLVENSDIRDFFIVCLSSILKEVSNADPKFLYALAISTKMREQNSRRIDAKKAFVERVTELMPKMITFSKACPRDAFAKLIGRDARDIDLPDESVDLAITSPPYLNAVDYPRAHQLQLYWLGLWKGRLADLKKAYIGTEQVSAKEYSAPVRYGNPVLDEALEKIYQVDRRRSYVVYKYFRDMRQNFVELKRVLKVGGIYCVAVADNVVRKTPVSTHGMLMDIAQEVGFRVIDHYASVLMMRPHNMRETEKISAEWVMAFKKET